MPGFTGQGLISCLFSAPGTFNVTTTASAADGFTASAATSAIATVRPVPPSPTPAPTPAPAAPRVSLIANAVRCTTTRAFWGFSATANVPIDRYEFEFGDGGDDSGAQREVGHEYSSEGFRTVTVAARQKDSGDTLNASLLIFVRFAAVGTTTCP
jgi:PKD repeat protein